MLTLFIKRIHTPTQLCTKKHVSAGWRHRWIRKRGMNDGSPESTKSRRGCVLFSHRPCVAFFIQRKKLSWTTFSLFFFFFFLFLCNFMQKEEAETFFLERKKAILCSLGSGHNSVNGHPRCTDWILNRKSRSISDRKSNVTISFPRFIMCWFCPFISFVFVHLKMPSDWSQADKKESQGKKNRVGRRVANELALSQTFFSLLPVSTIFFSLSLIVFWFYSAEVKQTTSFTNLSCYSFLSSVMCSKEEKVGEEKEEENVYFFLNDSFMALKRRKTI